MGYSSGTKGIRLIYKEDDTYRFTISIDVIPRKI